MIGDFIFELRKSEALFLLSIGCGLDPCERLTLFVPTEPNLLFCCLIVVFMIEMHCTGSAGNIKGFQFSLG